MSFRQTNKDPGNAWRKRHREELLAAGVPDSVVDEERRWTYVLLHGDDELENGWSPTCITKDQAVRLIRLLDLQYENRLGLELFRALEQRISD